MRNVMNNSSALASLARLPPFSSTLAKTLMKRTSAPEKTPSLGLDKDMTYVDGTKR